MPDIVQISQPDRIRAIKESGLLARARSIDQFNLITEHVRTALDVPVAIISIVDEDKQVFAGHCGLPSPWDARGETPLTHSFCQHVVESASPLVVNDANSHSLVHENHAIADLGVVAYLGVPISLPTGELVGALAAIDTQERVWTQREQRALESLARIVEREIAIGISELKYRSMFEDMQEGWYVASAVRDAEGKLVDVRFDEINPAFERLTGLPSDAVVGTRLSKLVPTAMADMIPAYEEVLSTGQGRVYANKEVTLGRWYENRIRKLEGDRIASVFTDVTDRKNAEELQSVVSSEMSHRLKNTLAMVQAIASQTLRPVEDRQYVLAFEKRIHTLSSAHDILFQSNWQSAALRAVIEASLESVGMLTRVAMSGPDIELGPRAALSTSLLIHELVTNAIKYGSLSSEAGVVTAEWVIVSQGDEESLDLTWRESGGPSILPPTSKGFGSKLIRMGMVGTGGVDIRYNPSGLVVTMTGQLKQLKEQ